MKNCLILIIALLNNLLGYAQKNINLKININSKCLNEIKIQYSDGVNLYPLNEDLAIKCQFSFPLNAPFGILSILPRNQQAIDYFVGEKSAVLNLSCNQNQELKVAKFENLISINDTAENIILRKYLTDIKKENLALNDLYSQNSINEVNNSDSLKSIQNYLWKIIDFKKMKIIEEYPNDYFSFFILKNIIEQNLYINPDARYLQELKDFLLSTFPSVFINTRETEYLIESINYKINAIKHNNDVSKWSFTDYSNKEIQLKNIESEYILIDFWATWCRPCMEQLSDLKVLSNLYTTSKLQVVALNVDRDYSKFIKQLATMSTAWIHVFDEQQRHVRFFDIRSFPTLILLDKNRQVIFTSTGYTDKSKLKNLIK